MKIPRTTVPRPTRVKPRCVTYYELLAAPPGSTVEELHISFNRLVVLLHPDKATGNTAVYQRITQAWGVLKNSQLRREYDARLTLQGSQCMYCQGKGLRSMQQSLTVRLQHMCDKCNGTGQADGGLLANEVWECV